MSDKLILYTNHNCPWAHRAHIALEELKLPFEEVIIDLSTPRTPEYLAINPRGLVPTLSFNGNIIPESGIVATFLTDQYPSHLVPASGAPGGALKRAQISFFVDAFLGKFQGNLFKFYRAADAEWPSIVEAALDGLVKEVEPQLADAAPFFGGSDKLTLAEVLTGSFVVRYFALSRAGLISPELQKGAEARAPNFTKWAEKVAAHPSVTKIFNEERIIAGAKARIEKLKSGN